MSEDYVDVGSIVSRVEGIDFNKLCEQQNSSTKPLPSPSPSPSHPRGGSRLPHPRAHSQGHKQGKAKRKEAPPPSNQKALTTDDLLEINVGGVYYTVLKSELDLFPSLLRDSTTDTQGRYFINADGKAFRYILHFLRRGEFHWPREATEQKILQDELKHYGLLECVGEPPLENEARLLKAAGSAIAKLNEIDSEYNISDKLTQTAITGIKKIKELDDAYHIHKTLGATLSIGANVAYELDQKYEIHQKVASALVLGCAKVVQIDNQFLVHEKLANALVKTVHTAQQINHTLKLSSKLSHSLVSSYQLACTVDQQYQVQEKVSWLFSESVKYLSSP